MNMSITLPYLIAYSTQVLNYHTFASDYDRPWSVSLNLDK